MRWVITLIKELDCLIQFLNTKPSPKLFVAVIKQADQMFIECIPERGEIFVCFKYIVVKIALHISRWSKCPLHKNAIVS